MAQLYSTGPALFYVGIPVNYTQIIAYIYQVQQNEVSATPPPQPISPGLVAGKLEVPLIPDGSKIVPGDPPEAVPISVAGFWEQLDTSYVPVFLGTAETPPTIEIIASWDAVETDNGGTEQPSERLTEGEEALIAADFTRFNELVYEVLAARSQTNAFAGSFPGWGQIGKAVALEGLTLPLWVVFPYSGKPVYGLAGQPFGYRFYRTVLESPDRLRVGSTPRVTSLRFRAQRLLQLVESTDGLKQPIPNYADIALSGPAFPPIGQVTTEDIDGSIGGLYDGNIDGLPAPD